MSAKSFGRLIDRLANKSKKIVKGMTTGKDKWFTAIYADVAVAQACIGCHNSDPLSPKRDFKRGDVMGAVVISIPAKE